MVSTSVWLVIINFRLHDTMLYKYVNNIKVQRIFVY